MVHNRSVGWSLPAGHALLSHTPSHSPGITHWPPAWGRRAWITIYIVLTYTQILLLNWYVIFALTANFRIRIIPCRFLYLNTESTNHTYTASLNFQLIVHTWREVMQHHHLAVRWEPRLLLKADPHQCFDGGWASDAAQAWRTDHLLFTLRDIAARPWWGEVGWGWVGWGVG